MAAAIVVVVAVAVVVATEPPPNQGEFRPGLDWGLVAPDGVFCGLEFAAALPDWKIPPDCQIGVSGLAPDWFQLPREKKGSGSLARARDGLVSGDTCEF